MKKMLCLMMSLMLMLGAVAAFAEVEYTLEEKWQRQVDFGNGIKGTLTMDVQGEAEWARLLASLSGVPLQIRAIHADEAFQYRIYAEKDENMVGVTQLYGDADNVYFSSDLMPDMLLSLATGGDVLARVTGAREGDTPSLYSVMRNLMDIPQTTWEGKWQPALDTYETAIELWLENYASAPSVKRAEDGSATVLVRYDIPGGAVKTQIKALWGNVLKDATLLPLLRAQMTQQQQDVYLNEHQKYYFDDVISGLSLKDNVVLEREMTARGDVIRTDVSLPLDYDGWTNLTVKQNGDATTIVLTGAEKTIALEVEKSASTADSSAYTGKVCITPADAAVKGFAAAFTLVEIKTFTTDEDTRSHDTSSWSLKLQPDESRTGDAWTAFDPMEINARVHLHSKALQYNPVTIEISFDLKLTDAQVSAVMELRTSSPWVLDSLPTEGAKDIASLSEEERTNMFVEMGLNGLTVLQMVNQNAPQALPEATASDLGAVQ